MRVLVVDDDEAQRLLLRVWFERHGAQVDTARDGQEGLDLAAQEPPDVIVLDLEMPRVDGWTVLTALRGRGQMVPVVVATARCGPGDEARVRRLGADDFLVKPYRLVELADAVEAVAVATARARDPDGLGRRARPDAGVGQPG